MDKWTIKWKFTSETSTPKRHIGAASVHSAIQKQFLSFPKNWQYVYTKDI